MSLNHLLVGLIQADREAAIARQQLATQAASARTAPAPAFPLPLRHPHLSPAR